MIGLGSSSMATAGASEAVVPRGSMLDAFARMDVSRCQLASIRVLMQTEIWPLQGYADGASSQGNAGWHGL